jgi:hypothetical protein
VCDVVVTDGLHDFEVFIPFLIRHAFGATPSPMDGGRLCCVSLLDLANKHTATIGTCYKRQRQKRPFLEIGGRLC